MYQKILVLAAAWLLGTAGLFVRSLPFQVPAPIIGGVRGIFGFALLWMLFVALNRSGLSQVKPAFSKHTRWVWIGGISLAMNAVLSMAAMQLTSTGNTYALSNATPVYLLGIRWAVDGTRPSKRQLAIAMVTLLGLAMTFAESVAVGKGVLGIFLALFAGITFSMFIFSQLRLPLVERFGVTLVGNALAPLVAFAAVPLFWGQFANITPHSWAEWSWCFAILGGLALVQYALPLTTFANLAPKVGTEFMSVMPSVAAITSSLWPALAGLEAWPSPLEWAGAITIHVSVVIAARTK